MEIIQKHNQKLNEMEKALKEMVDMKQEIFNELKKLDYQLMMEKFNELGPSVVKLEILDMLIKEGVVKITS